MELQGPETFPPLDPWFPYLACAGSFRGPTSPLKAGGSLTKLGRPDAQCAGRLDDEVDETTRALSI